MEVPLLSAVDATGRAPELMMTGSVANVTPTTHTHTKYLAHCSVLRRRSESLDCSSLDACLHWDCWAWCVQLHRARQQQQQPLIASCQVARLILRLRCKMMYGKSDMRGADFVVVTEHSPLVGNVWLLFFVSHKISLHINQSDRLGEAGETLVSVERDVDGHRYFVHKGLIYSFDPGGDLIAHSRVAFSADHHLDRHQHVYQPRVSGGGQVLCCSSAISTLKSLLLFPRHASLTIFRPRLRWMLICAKMPSW
jgi:hypothetical protein